MKLLLIYHLPTLHALLCQTNLFKRHFLLGGPETAANLHMFRAANVEQPHKCVILNKLQESDFLTEKYSLNQIT